MGKVYAVNLYISDLHFGHSNVINFDKRPFADTTEMDNAMIYLWNSRVSTDDNVYVIGDFSYRSIHPAEWYLRQLKGHRHLIIGNHDGETLKSENAMSYFESVDKMMHVHGRVDDIYYFMKNKGKALHAAACVNNYTPASVNELIRNNQRFTELNG